MCFIDAQKSSSDAHILFSGSVYIIAVDARGVTYTTQQWAALASNAERILLSLDIAQRMHDARWNGFHDAMFAGAVEVWKH